MLLIQNESITVARSIFSLKNDKKLLDSMYGIVWSCSCFLNFAFLMSMKIGKIILEHMKIVEGIKKYLNSQPQSAMITMNKKSMNVSSLAI